MKSESFSSRRSLMLRSVMAKTDVMFPLRRVYRRTTVVLVTLAVTMLLLPGVVWSQASVPTRVEIGDSVEAVEHALHLAGRTTAIDGVRQNPGQIRLQTRGIWIFFNGWSQAYQYRFDAPFAGEVDGATIGASVDQVQSTFGTSGKEIPAVALPYGRSYLYRLKPDTTIRVDFDGAGKARTIRVLSGAVVFTEAAVHQEPPAQIARQLPLVTTRRGRMTDLTVPGSLRVNRDPACIALDAIDTSLQPPDLYAASGECVAANRYPDAVRLFMIAGAEAVFDGLRVKDKTAAQARQVMILNMTNRWSPQQHSKFYDSFNAIVGDSAATAQVCRKAQQLGPPTYYPRYMILHGIQALMGGPPDNGLESSFDAHSAWAKIQRIYLRCGMPPVITGVPEGKLAKREFTLHDDFYITSVAWSPDGRYIAADSPGAAAIHVWDVLRRQKVAIIATKFGAPILYPSLSWSPDGRYLVRCDRWLKAYATENWQLAHIFATNSGACEYATFSSDGKRLAVLGGGVLSVYAVGTWRLLNAMGLGTGWARGHRFQAISYVPGTHTLILGGYDFEGTLGVDQTTVGRVWVLRDLSSDPAQSIEAYLERPDGHFRGDVRSLAVTPDGALVATGTSTGNGGPPSSAVIDSVHVFDLRRGVLVGAVPDGVITGVQRAMSYTPDGRYLVVLQDGVKKAIVILDARTLRVADTLDLDNMPYDLSIRGDGRAFAAGLGDEVVAWSLPGS